MTAQNKENNAQYRKAREEFDGLKIEEKAIFLVESAFSMLARGIEAVGNVFSEQINKIYDDSEEGDVETPSKPAPRKTSTRKKTTKSTAKSSSSARSAKETDTGAAD